MISEEVLFSNETYTKTRIVMHTQSGDVVTYLATPKNPKAAIVYAPGAGEKIAGHEDRMVKYTAAGYAFMFTDSRAMVQKPPAFHSARSWFSRITAGLKKGTGRNIISQYAIWSTRR